jgi:phosphoglycolate phosphatase
LAQHSLPPDEPSRAATGTNCRPSRTGTLLSFAAYQSRARWRSQRLDAVLFDLDGTLMDTLADITLALNRALAEQRLVSLSPAEVRPLIGRGGPLLIERAAAHLGAPMDSRALEQLHERFARHARGLQQSNESTAVLFPGVLAGLEALNALGLKIAVVTNKQQRLALELIARHGLGRWVQTVVGGDECERRKPDPQPLHMACERLQVSTARALMVGDSLNDVLAARAAGMPVVCVPYGYNEGNDARMLPCDAFIESVSELPSLLEGESAPVRAAE